MSPLTPTPDHAPWHRTPALSDCLTQPHIAAAFARDALVRELEADGIVHREEYAEVPPRVEYSLTARGVALNEALVPLGAWGKAHVLSASPAPGQVGEDDHVALVAGTA